MSDNASHVRVVDWGGELPDNTPLWRYMKLSTFLLLLEGQNEAISPTTPIVRRSSLLGKIRDDEETDAMLRNYRKRENWVRREDLPPPLDAL